MQKSLQIPSQKTLVAQCRFLRWRYMQETFVFGIQLGRPRIDAALEKRIQAQLRAGKGMLKVARECGVGSGTVQRVKQEMEGPFDGVAA
jgi:hypothetical protein